MDTQIDTTATDQESTPTTRRRALAITLAVALLLACVGGGVWAWKAHKARQARDTAAAAYTQALTDYNTAVSEMNAARDAAHAKHAEPGITAWQTDAQQLEHLDQKAEPYKQAPPSATLNAQQADTAALTTAAHDLAVLTKQAKTLAHNYKQREETLDKRAKQIALDKADVDLTRAVSAASSTIKLSRDLVAKAAGKIDKALTDDLTRAADDLDKVIQPYVAMSADRTELESVKNATTKIAADTAALEGTRQKVQAAYDAWGVKRGNEIMRDPTLPANHWEVIDSNTLEPRTPAPAPAIPAPNTGSAPTPQPAPAPQPQAPHSAPAPNTGNSGGWVVTNEEDQCWELDNYGNAVEIACS